MAVAFTQLQKDKWIHMFELLDVDGNGLIEYTDFRTAIDVMAEDLGWNKSHRRYQGLMRANQRLWKMYSRHFDQDADGVVTMPEWLNFHIQAFLKDPLRNGFDPATSAALRDTSQFFIDMLDSDLDGNVSEDDHVVFCHAYHVGEDEARRCFREFDRNQNGVLQVEEVLLLIQEFYLSDDPAALGNLFFGRL